MQMRFKGKEAIGIAVSMRKGGDVLRLGKQMTETVGKLQREFPVGIAIDAVSDQPKVVQDSIGEFVKSLAEAVIIVLAVESDVLRNHLESRMRTRQPGAQS